MFIVCCSLSLHAAHIVGGDFYYRCLGNNQYEITLKVYKDCFATGPNVADFDNPAFIGLFDQLNLLYNRYEVYLESRRNIPPVTGSPCGQAPANVCVEEGVYKFIVTLPINEVFTVAYQRCCRNHTINNIITPSNTGATYTVRIDTRPQTNCNNSPVFNQFPPIVVCAGEQIIFDHSANDPDGDRLEYELCTPNTGADQTDPQPFTPSFPPYLPVQWLGPYNNNYQLASNPPLSIDRNTGLLTGTPNQIGQYVVGVCVKEFRGNVLIGEVRRDFQFNVTQCQTNVQARIPTLNVSDPAAVGTAGVYAYECSDFTINFVNTSINGTYYHWDFGVLGTNTDTSTLFQPAYTYPDTGYYIVTLVVNPGYACADTTKVLVRIYPNFVTGFNFTEQCEGIPIAFTDQTVSTFNDVNSWTWNFGDGNSSTTQSPQHLYNSPGTYNVTLISTSSKGCRDTLSRTVVQHPKPDADFENTPTCINTPINFFDSSTLPFDNIVTWDWRANGVNVNNNSSFNATYNSLQTFTLTLIVTTDFGCKDTVTKNITVYPLPVIDYSPDAEVCEGDTIQLFASGGEQYDWYSSAGDTLLNIENPIVIIEQSKSFTVVVTDSNQCSTSGAFNIVAFPLPPANAGADDYVCLGSLYQLNGSGGVSYSWSPGDVLNDSTVSNPTANITDTTTFVLTVVSVQGCPNTDTVTINVQSPIVPFASGDTFICAKDTVQLNAGGGLYYEWFPATGLNDAAASNPLASPSSTTQYFVRIANDCFDDTLTVNVEVFQLPFVNAGIDDTIYRSESTVLNGSAGYDFFWTPGISLSDSTSRAPTASPLNTTDYILTVTDFNGCVNRDTVQIFVIVRTLLVVPTAFSPNNDGRNDRFRIIRALNIAKLEGLRVFNRWGQLVWETNDLNGWWDGTFKGEPAPAEVYTYYAKAITYDGEFIIEKGNLTLVR